MKYTIKYDMLVTDKIGVEKTGKKCNLYYDVV